MIKRPGYNPKILSENERFKIKTEPGTPGPRLLKVLMKQLCLPNAF